MSNAKKRQVTIYPLSKCQKLNCDNPLHSPLVKMNTCPNNSKRRVAGQDADRGGARKRQRRLESDQDEDEIERKRRLGRERRARWLARQSQETVARLRREHTQHMREVRNSETIEEANERRAQSAESWRNRVSQRVAVQRDSLQSQSLREFNEEVVEKHNCGSLTIVCEFCGSKNFLAEKPQDGKFNSCCRKGKLKLPTIRGEHNFELKYPQFMQSFLSDPNFRKHIRSYNGGLSFASMGAKIVDVPGRGPYVFKVQGQIYHKTSHMVPPPGKNFR